MKLMKCWVACALWPLTAFAAGEFESEPPNHDGYLLFELLRHEYGEDNDTQLSQKFKVRIDHDFFTHFPRAPEESNAGTMFGCHGGRATEGPTVDFSWWASPTTNGRLKSWGWSSGTEIVHGEIMEARNPTTTSIVGFADWTQIDWLLEPTFTRWSEDSEEVWGVNLSFAVRFIPQDALSEAELVAIPNAPATDVYGNTVIEGDSQIGLSHQLSCYFQN